MTTADPIPPPDPRPAEPATAGPRRRGTLRRLAAAIPMPHHLLFNAIFQKEMRVSGRKNSIYICRFIFGLLLVGLAVLVFVGSQAETHASASASAATVQQLQTVAPHVTSAVVWFQLLFLSLVAAMLAAPTICEEVRARSLPALLTTPLTAAQIIFAKHAGATVHAVIIALMTLPLLLGLRVFGGVDAATIWAGACITISAAVLAAGIAIVVSLYAKRPALAGSTAIGIVLGVQVLPLPFGFLLMARGVISQQVMMAILSTTSAPFALGETTAAAAGSSMLTGTGLPPSWALNTAYNLVATVLLLLFASSLFRRRLTGDRAEQVAEQRPTTALPRRARRAALAQAAPAQPESGPPAAPPTSPSPDISAATAAPPTAAPTAAPIAPVLEPGASRTIGDHPVLWRELRRQGPAGGARWRTPMASILPLCMLLFGGVIAPFYGILASRRHSLSLAVDHAMSPDSRVLVIMTFAFAGIVAALLTRTLRRAAGDVPRYGLVRHPSKIMSTFLVVVGILLFSYWVSDGDYDGVNYMLVVIAPVVALLRAASQNAGTLAEEREARTWETLLTTPLSPRAILIGKLAGAMARQWEVPAIIGLHAVVCCVMLGNLTPLLVPQLLAVVISAMLFLSGTGALCSLLAAKGSTASLLNVSVALTLWLVVPVVVALLAAALRVSPSDMEAIGAIILATNPITLAFQAMQGAMESGWRGSVRYNLGSGSLSPAGFNAVLFGVCAAYVALGAASLWTAVRAFNKRTGRPS